MSLKLALSLCFVAAPLLVACGGETVAEYPVAFVATADGQPLAGVELLVDGARVGVTGPEGRRDTVLRGAEGTRVDVVARCPDGHREAEPMPPLVLRPVGSLDPGQPGRAVERRVECPPAQRRAVVLVHAHGQAELPVLVDGREMARTDRDGTAHVQLELAPGTSVQLTMATPPTLRPMNPSFPLTMPDEDRVFLFEREFEVEAPRRRRVWRRAPVREARPRRISTRP